MNEVHLKPILREPCDFFCMFPLTSFSDPGSLLARRMTIVRCGCVFFEGFRTTVSNILRRCVFLCLCLPGMKFFFCIKCLCPDLQVLAMFRLIMSYELLNCDAFEVRT